MFQTSQKVAVSHNCTFHTDRIGRVSVISVEGALDWVSAPQLSKLAIEAINERALVVDLTGTTKVDSAGNGAIIAALGRRHAARRRTALAVVDGLEVQVLDVLGVDGVVPVCGTVEAAAAGLGAELPAGAGVVAD
jgi:anti-anti-sigma factor